MFSSLSDTRWRALTAFTNGSTNFFFEYVAMSTWFVRQIASVVTIDPCSTEKNFSMFSISLEPDHDLMKTVLNLSAGNSQLLLRLAE